MEKPTKKAFQLRINRIWTKITERRNVRSQIADLEHWTYSYSYYFITATAAT
jgi:hypothetical protein